MTAVDHTKVAAKCRKAASRRWFKVGDYPNRQTSIVMASMIRLGKIRAYAPGGSFESKAEGTEVWARILN